MTRVLVVDRDDGEMITIVNMPSHYLAGPAQRSRVYFPIPEDITDWAPVMDGIVEPAPLKTVWLEPFRLYAFGADREAAICWGAYPSDGELALLLKAAFLPGQVGEVHRRENMARLQGMFNGAFGGWR